MPVSDESAALQFFIEALKQNTAVLERVGKTMEGLQSEQKETLKLVHDTRERIIRIESGGQSEQIKEIREKQSALEEEVHTLKRASDRRDGALGLAEWFFKNWPAVIGFVVLVGVILRNEGKL